jgi:hypothetical protein
MEINGNLWDFMEFSEHHGRGHCGKESSDGDICVIQDYQIVVPSHGEDPRVVDAGCDVSI